jgi:hypothetical protein
MREDITLHMGFVNTPYTRETKLRPIASAKVEEKRKVQRNFSKTMTAPKVANILERKYDIVETFSKIYEDEINSLLHERYSEIASKFISEGKSTTATLKNLMKPSTKKIESMFRQFIDGEEMNGMVPGVPTEIALGGKIRKKGGRRFKSRPSFEKSGIYRASFRAWVE